MSEAEQASPAETREVVELVTVDVGPSRYAFEVGRVAQVTDVPNVTRLPRTVDLVKGLASVGGEMVCVLDMRTAFDLPPSDEDGKLLVLKREHEEAQRIGVVIDAISDIERFPVDAIERPEERPSAVAGPWVTAVVGAETTADDDVAVLGVERLAASIDIEQETTTQ
ncbi:chemotaxis protein CheW [Halomarina salina]|uniref:Chemotaxis protein CheW n=1 Tax=Halomarina salina TaxID=1872699 RepID=A0ABD5RKE9_9EURY